MAQVTYLYRAPLKGSGIAYEEWKDDAACKDLPIQLFELGDVDGAEGKTSDYQHQLIASGLRVCVACPVRQACKVNSSELDRYWTTRGGQPPEGLFTDSKMPEHAASGRLKRDGFKSFRAPKEKCKRGHENWAIKSDGNRRCLDCVKVSNAARSKRAGTIES
jgi:hypothetical protein